MFVISEEEKIETGEEGNRKERREKGRRKKKTLAKIFGHQHTVEREKEAGREERRKGKPTTATAAPPTALSLV
ncbi:hypothetical protein U1Q18_028008, partial [Sarracenia purpurea var. burkii]